MKGKMKNENNKTTNNNYTRYTSTMTQFIDKDFLDTFNRDTTTR